MPQRTRDASDRVCILVKVGQKKVVASGAAGDVVLRLRPLGPRGRGSAELVNRLSRLCEETNSADEVLDSRIDRRARSGPAVLRDNAFLKSAAQIIWNHQIPIGDAVARQLLRRKAGKQLLEPAAEISQQTLVARFDARGNHQ